jgi:membrane protease YdiL (CAAX protease family)
MNDPFQSASALAPAIGVTVAIAVSTLVWIAIGRRILRREPLVPYEGRRPVPWKNIDVAVIFGLYFLPMLVGLAIFAFQATSDGESVDEPEISRPSTTEAADGEKVDTQHSAIDLLLQDGTAATWMLCFVAAVVVAPIAEEFLFRLVLQGRFEAVERGHRRSGMRLACRGAGPILFSSILFAAIHFRQAAPPADPGDLKMAILFQICWSPLTVVYALAWLRFRMPDFTAADLGIDPRKVKSDIGLGLMAFLAVACPIYLLQAVLTWLFAWLWPNVATDPIPLFFFALVLGFLYYRTHRLLPAIVLHMALNGASLLIVWLSLSQTVGG